MSRGFILIEAMVGYVILAFALAALVPVFLLALRAQKKSAQVQTAALLSGELLEEVRMRKWDQTTPSPVAYTTVPSSVLGPDAGETVSDKTTFNDVDDFNGWSEHGVLDPTMRSVAGFSSYTRTVRVRYVDSNLAVSASTSDYKQVTVCTSAPAISSVCLDTILTNR